MPRLLAAVFAILICATAPALAGIADTPLPVILPGSTTLHLYSVPGVIGGGGGVSTFFSCTSTDTVPIQVGVEVFGSLGGGAANDAVTTSLSVVPGATVIFGTQSAAWISINSNLGAPVSRGSARILATSKKLACTAFIADNANAPPASA